MQARLAGLVAATILAAGVMIAGTLSPRASEEAPPLPFDQLFGGSFTLIDHDGNARTEMDYFGRFALITFGYTTCPDICPTNLQAMARALDLIGSRAMDVQPLFISLDPQRDTPEVLKDYVGYFGETFVGLTGAERDVADVVRAYRIHRVKVIPEWSKSADDYLVDHSSLTFLVGPDGKVLTIFPHDTAPETMAMRLRNYMGAEG